jgi:TolB-like protein
MPVSKLAVALSLVVASRSLAETPEPAPRKAKVAVLEFRPLGTEQVKADLLSEVALTEAYGIAGIDVIGRSDIASMLGFEQQKRVLGCGDDPACVAEIGGALGTEYILVGSLGRLGNMFRLDLKLVETRRARVLGRIGESIDAREEALIAAVQRGVRQLLQPIAVRPSRSAPPSVEAAPVPPQPAPPVRGPDLSPAPPPRAQPAVAATAPRPPSGRRTAAWVTGGAGLALVAGGALAGLAARGAFDDEKAAAAQGDRAAYDDAKAKTKRMSLLADGLFLGGAACVGASTWLFFSSTSPGVAVSAAPWPGGAIAVAAGAF